MASTASIAEPKIPPVPDMPALVPMFHASAWGVASAGPASGAKLVMPGPKLDGASLHDLMSGRA